MSIELNRMPDAFTGYLKALGSARRKPDREVQLPPLSLSIASVAADPDRLERYRAICGFEAGAGLPITYPQVLAAPLQIHLLTQAEFPLPLLGLVHLHNRIEQQRPLREDGHYAARIAIAGSRQTEKGLEFDLETGFSDEHGQDVWRAVATVLYRNRRPSSGSKRPAYGDLPLSDYCTFEAPADIGRRYGRIAGDMNPIHLYPLTARLFGFPRAIAHGMWSLARCAALLEARLGRAPQQLTAQFRQPLFLPARVALKFRAAEDGLSFALFGRQSGKTHLSGALR